MEIKTYYGLKFTIPEIGIIEVNVFPELDSHACQYRYDDRNSVEIFYNDGTKIRFVVDSKTAKEVCKMFIEDHKRGYKWKNIWI